MSNDTNDQTEKLACMKRLHDALSEAIAALESGRDADVEYRYPEHAWHRYQWLDTEHRDYRCVIKPREVWVNEYPGGGLAAWPTREEADKRALGKRIRCTRFVEALREVKDEQ